MYVEKLVVYVVQTEDDVITVHHTKKVAQKALDRRNGGVGRILTRVVQS